MSMAQSRANLFSFPPEAVAHIAFMFDDLFPDNSRYIEMREKETDAESLIPAVSNQVSPPPLFCRVPYTSPAYALKVEPT